MMKSFALCLLLLGTVADLSGADGSRLIPFQARLSDATGKLLVDGVRLIQFQIYSEPALGSLLWAGELHRTSINGGLVNVILGSKNALPGDRADQPDKSFFDQPLYLQITVDANDDNQITSADPPLSPRQTILPIFFASESAFSRDSHKLAGHDWTVIFGANNPTGRIDGARLANITSNSISPGTIDASRIAPETITSNQLSLELLLDAIIPPGTVIAFAGDSSVPRGWLYCDGRGLRSEAYPRLFAAIGTAWGRGIPNSPTNFNLPDLRGLFLRGANKGRTDGYGDPDSTFRTNSVPIGRLQTGGQVSGNSGDAVGSLQKDELRLHSHLLRALGSFVFGPPYDTVVVGNSGYFQSLGNVQETGGLETRPVNASINYIIKF